MFDGEIVSLDKKGKPVFNQVISRLHSKSTNQHSFPARAYIFDLVVHNGKLCTSLPWNERRKLLEKSKFDFPALNSSEIFDDGMSLKSAVQNLGMEGIMIKDRNAPYLFGHRPKTWRKLKIRHKVDCSIIGYTKGSGDRSSLFGSLHIAELLEDELVYRGKVGTGWKHKEMVELFEILKLQNIAEDSQFEEVKNSDESTWFSKPFLKCEVKYASLTPSQTFREPVFISLYY